jgi:VCBS repeat-containing protein
LYLPEGQLFKPDASVQDYDDSENEFFNLHFSGDYNYKVEGSKIKCLNCPAGEDDGTEENSVENDTVNEVSVKINGKEILSGKKTKGKLTTDENGVIIKIN